MSILQIRLKHCIQAILDLQPHMRRIYQRDMRENFSSLRAYLERAENMALEEEEVAKIETLTADFLREIRLSSSRPLARAAQ